MLRTFSRKLAQASRLELNGRSYQLPSATSRPLVGVCIDGCQVEYLYKVVETGKAPFFQTILEGQSDQKTSLLVNSAMPSFTNPNNMSIATGVPPREHGIAGNFYLDIASKQRVMMNSPELLRVPTLFSALQESGVSVAVVTSKDKLRALLSLGLKGEADRSQGAGRAWAFSAERSDEVSKCIGGEDWGGIGPAEAFGIPHPESVYSAELTEFIFAAGVELMKRYRPQVTYLSTTDYIQHMWAPGTPEANQFYQMMDSYLLQMEAMGVSVAITADHGMAAKHDPKTLTPNVVFLSDLIKEAVSRQELPESVGSAEVILPITDPYVVHHGALGGLGHIYLSQECTVSDRTLLLEWASRLEGVEVAVTGDESAVKFELPRDRIGDITVVTRRDYAVGSSESEHDLSGLHRPLRSHGGLSEQQVPFLMNWGVLEGQDVPTRNFDLFHSGLNNLTEA